MCDISDLRAECDIWPEEKKSLKSAAASKSSLSAAMKSNSDLLILVDFMHGLWSENGSESAPKVAFCNSSPSCSYLTSLSHGWTKNGVAFPVPVASTL